VLLTLDAGKAVIGEFWEHRSIKDSGTQVLTGKFKAQADRGADKGILRGPQRKQIGDEDEIDQLSKRKDWAEIG